MKWNTNNFRVMKCLLCGTDHTVVAAPMSFDPNKWVIYRDDGVEIEVYIKDNRVVESKRITEEERRFIIKHAIKR